MPSSLLRCRIRGLFLLQAMDMRIEQAFIAAGVFPGDASKYAAALARDGFDSLGELIAGKALDADVLVPMDINQPKEPHARSFSHRTPAASQPRQSTREGATTSDQRRAGGA